MAIDIRVRLNMVCKNHMAHYDLIFRQIVTKPSFFSSGAPARRDSTWGRIPESTSRFLFSDPHDEQMDRNWVVQYSEWCIVRVHHLFTASLMVFRWRLALFIATPHYLGGTTQIDELAGDITHWLTSYIQHGNRQAQKHAFIHDVQ
jgi:hypothetical protein